MELPNRTEIEAEFIRRMNRLSDKHAKQLREYLGDPPDTGRVPSAFWQQVEKERADDLAAMLILLFILGGTQLRPTNAQQAEHLQTQGQFWSRDKAREVASSYAKRSREALEVRARRWRDADVRVKQSELRSELAEVFSRDRDESIAITTTTEARQAGGEAIAKNLGITSPDDYWQTEEDAKVCPVCAPLNDAKRDEWELKFPSGPPAHPRCRCEIVYAAELAKEFN
jgi:RNA polymerase subunit RPABC4/transcription elongation factor Spt4